MRNHCKIHGFVESPSWKFTADGDYCDLCFRATTFPAGIVTSTSSRVYQDRLENEKELTQPYIGAKPNPDFIKNYPTHAPDYFDQKELKEMGAGKLKSRKGKRFKYE
jgi:hypothetical protein